ncbi:uncharacterized protein DUF2249 [Fontibacillus phaseoli]|uniref:Uncharacterized protein DUF2249 n=1 Tax=Fontibacillus phaseoli TaxID=1416533 RepID=A0A369B718_9BACL|nr:DUF2249 domain-containing protein [Fontibacillus phaseoli]RCX17303.1 uncharacterized protein DUF2249 [Fontibacillus phaseoli]
MTTDNHAGAGIVELDVRPQLRSGEEPFTMIMDTFNALKPDETFVLHATIKPVPLIPKLEARGYESTCEQVSGDHWIVTFVPKSN